jgi:hypothetical protein
MSTDEANWQIIRDGRLAWQGADWETATMAYYHAAKELGADIGSVELQLLHPDGSLHRKLVTYSARQPEPDRFDLHPGRFTAEWDPDFWGGDYEGVGEKVKVDYALSQMLGIDAAFYLASGEDPQHLVWYGDGLDNEEDEDEDGA